MSEADEERARQRRRWEGSAAGWLSVSARMQRYAAPVSVWMIDQARLQPGHDVLELAAGVADTGLLAAELIRPGGSLTISDASEGMLEGARVRAAELGVEGVEFRLLELEWIDAPTATYDAVLVRWGLMFATDLEASLRDIRRVLRVGGRLAATTWADPEANPWATAQRRALYDQGLVAELIDPGPGPFTLADPAHLIEAAEATGFTEVEVTPIEMMAEHESFEDFWDLHSTISAGLRDVLARSDARSVAALKAAVAANLAPYTDAEGRLRVPGRALGLAAGA